jgi:hypothetical protein
VPYVYTIDGARPTIHQVPPLGQTAQERTQALGGLLIMAGGLVFVLLASSLTRGWPPWQESKPERCDRLREEWEERHEAEPPSRARLCAALKKARTTGCTWTRQYGAQQAWRGCTGR